jgi:hypothetical protein
LFAGEKKENTGIKKKANQFSKKLLKTGLPLRRKKDELLFLLQYICQYMVRQDGSV